MSQSQIDKVTKLKDQASAKFEIAVTASEKKIFDEAVTLISELEKTTDGKIKASIANLKRLSQIKTKLAKVANNKDYLQAVQDLAKEFESIYKAQAKYFASLTTEMHHEKKYATIKELAVENTIGGLVGAGLQSNVTDKLNDMLLRAVTSGAKYADLMEEMRTYLRGDTEHQGALARYANTYTITALNQYAGQNNKILTDDLGLEWFEYTGSEIETTREFCEKLCAKRWVHRSEIPEILKGHIDGHKCKIYPKTKLPYGLIEGTNAENFQVNVGGWNCRHQLIPVAKEMVPANIRAKFEKPQTNESTKDWDEFMTDPVYGKEADNFAAWKKNVFPELDLGCLVDKTAKKEDLIEQRRKTAVQLITLQNTFWYTQMKLQRSKNKAVKNGLETLAIKAEKAIEDNKLLVAPKSKAEYLQKVSNMQSVIDEIKTATSGKPANKQAAKPTVQTKEITMNTVRISSTMTKAEIFEKRAKWIQNHLKVTEQDAKRYQEGIDRFTGNDYADIRSVQTGDMDDPAIKKIADDIEEFISKSAKWAGGTTYRGLYLFDYNDYLKKTIDGFRNAQATRTPIQMYGMSSWSTEKSIAEEFAFRDGDVHVIFICKNGQPQGTSIDGLSRHAGEHEVLASNNARWLITRINQVNQTYYEIEVTPC